MAVTVARHARPGSRSPPSAGAPVWSGNGPSFGRLVEVLYGFTRKRKVRPMNSTIEGGYRPRLHGLLIAALALLVAGMSTLSSAAQANQGFGGGGQVGGDAYKYAAAPYAHTYDDILYEYATGDDGKGYYTTYDGEEWSSWTGWDDQPADYQWKPSGAVYGDKQYVAYNGKDGKYYYNAYDANGWSGWEDAAGDEYKFEYAPYLNTYEDQLYLYGKADDGYAYYKSYDGEEWTSWAKVSTVTAGDYQVYAVDWDGYNNVFYTGEDGKVYWNRYDGEKWTGEKALPYKADEYEYGYAPYAVGYAEDEKLYAYATGADGTPYYNAFDGTGWSGWDGYEYELPAKAKYQPSAYEYDGKQHVIYTADDGHAYYTAYDGEYAEWQDLGENYDYDPYQYEYKDGYYLTYTGTDKYVYYKAYDGATDDGGGYETPTPAY